MIGIFRNVDKNSEHREAFAMNSVLDGINSLGLEYFSTSIKEYKPCDIAIVWGSHKNIRGDSYFLKNIYDCQTRNGNKIVVIEKGFLQREDYYLVGWDRPGGLGYYKNENMSADRFKKLKIEVKPWKQKQNEKLNMLVCGQIPWDQNIQDISLRSWCGFVSHELSTKLDKSYKIRYKPHPKMMRHKGFGHRYDKAIDMTSFGMATVEEENLLKVIEEKKIDIVICYSSNSAVESVIGGIPTITFNQSSMAWDVTSHEINHGTITNPFMPDRTQWLNNLAYTQWNLEEISQGLPFKHLGVA